MPPMCKLLPLGLAAVLLAGCGGGAVAEGPVTRPAAADSPPGGPAATPTAAASAPGACSLVTQSDLVAVTKPTVTLEFVGSPAEESGTDPLGTISTCRQGLRSSWSDDGGTGTVDGVVTVRIQATGAARYFPNSNGEPVTGIGDDAFGRGRELYVRLGGGVLVLDVAISNPADDQRATQIAWATALARMAVDRM